MKIISKRIKKSFWGKGFFFQKLNGTLFEQKKGARSYCNFLIHDEITDMDSGLDDAETQEMFEGTGNDELSFKDIIHERQLKMASGGGSRMGQIQAQYLTGNAYEWERMSPKTYELVRDPKEDAELLLSEDVAAWSSPQYSHKLREARLSSFEKEEAVTEKISSQWNNYEQWSGHIEVYKYWWNQCTRVRWEGARIQEEMFSHMPQLKKVLKNNGADLLSKSVSLEFVTEMNLKLVRNTIELGAAGMEEEEERKMRNLFAQLSECHKNAKLASKGFSESLPGLEYSLKLTPDAYASLSHPVYAKMRQIRHEKYFYHFLKLFF